MSQVIYNGVSLAYVRTVNYEYSSPASVQNPDMPYREGKLVVEAVIALETYPTMSAASVTDLANQIQHALELPRKSFVYIRNGETVVDLSGAQDDQCGPFPFGVSVKKTANASLIVQWGVVWRIADCSSNPNTILSLKWKESATINDAWLTVKKRTGRLVISSRKNLVADSFRGIVTPGIDPGFVRTESTYTLAENGVELEFSFTDEQRTTMPPWPAIKASGKMSETTAYPGGMRLAQIDIRLEGPPGVDKKDLLKKAIEIAMTRVLGTAFVGREGAMIMWGGISEDLFANAIELTVRWNVKNTAMAVQLVSGEVAIPPAQPGNVNSSPTLAMSVPWLGAPIPGTDPKDRGLATPLRGTVDFLGLVAAAFRDPCLLNTLQADSRPNAGVNQLVGTNQRAYVRTVPKLSPEAATSAYVDATDGVYDGYKVVCHYHHDEGVTVCRSMRKGTPGQKIRLSAEGMRLVVEWTARRTGGLPVIPDPQITDGNAVYISGTISPESMELAGDGTSAVYTISGIYNYEFLDPCSANIVSPVPPFMARSVVDEARLSAAKTSGQIVWLNNNLASNPVNPFCGTGLQTVQLASGGQTGLNGIVGGGGFPFS